MKALSERLPAAAVVAAGALWGSMGLFVRHFSAMALLPVEIGEIRMLLGLLILGLYLLLRHRALLAVRWKDLWCFAGTGIGSLLLLNWTYYSAMEHASLAVAGVLLYTAPAFVMLLSALLFRERVTARKLLALLLAFSGCALVAGIGSDSHVSLLGLLFGLGAGVSYALYSIFGRYAVARGYGSFTITFYSFVFCVAGGAFFCRWDAVAAAMAAPPSWLWAAAMGLTTAFAPYLLYSYGLKYLEGSRAAILASVEPVVAALLSVAVFHEPMGAAGVLGMALVLSAIVLLSRQKPQG